MGRISKGVFYDSMYCHNKECIEFGVPQQVPVYPATWDEPASWAKDPECSSCYSWLKENIPKEEEHE